MSMRSNMGEVTKGAEVYDANNEKVGKVVEVGRNSFKVEKGFIFHTDMHLPMSAVAQADGKNVRLRVAKDRVMTMGAERLPAEGHEWYGTDTRETGRSAEHARTGRGGEDISVPVVEEQLKAGVREKEAGTARIVKDVREEKKTIDVPVQHEEVYVTERKVDRAATKEDLAAMDREIDIPLKRQEVVTSKEAVVTGEVGIRKETVTDTERVTDTVRRQDVHVEGGERARVHTEGAEMRRGTETGGAGKTVTDKRKYDAQGNLVDEKVTEKPNRSR